MSSQLGHVTNICGFISIGIIPITAKLDILVEHCTLILPGRNDGVTTTRSRE